MGNVNVLMRVVIKVRRCMYDSSDVNIVMMMFFEIFLLPSGKTKAVESRCQERVMSSCIYLNGGNAGECI